MKRFSVPTWLVFTAILAGATQEVAAQQLPAVSGINGKLEFDAGLLSLPSPTFMTRAAGTLTVPLGDQFGLQVDVHATALPSFGSGGAVHLFTRDPARYLIGGALGAIQTPGALVAAAGPEAELYFDRWTLEAWAGATYAHPTATAAAPDRLAPFAMGTLAYYPDDNLRLSVGLSTLDGYTAFHVGSEFQFTYAPLPLSVLANARVGQDGAILATIGLKAYLGAPEKTLIRRHREDDPVDLGTTLYASAGGRTLVSPASAEPPPASASSEPPPDQLPSQPPPSQLPSMEPPPPKTEPGGSSGGGHQPSGNDDDDDDHHHSGGHNSSSSSPPSSSSGPTPDIGQCFEIMNSPAYWWNGYECLPIGT